VGVMLIGNLKPKAPYTEVIRSRQVYPESERAALLSV
jgi:hypothetical protein